MERNPLDLELEELAGQLDWLQALAVGMVADYQAAEDLVQRALQEATAKGGWQPGKLKPWLVGTMRNLAKQYFRTEKRRRRREERVVEQARIRSTSLAEAADEPSPEQLASQVESQLLLSQAVLDIEEPYRSTILLFYYGGWSQQRIAENQGVSLRTVETRLRRARRRLRDALQGQYGKESWAMALVPLLLRTPPPSCPPPMVAAGPGSVGAGWWVSAALAMGVGLWAWGALEKEVAILDQGQQARLPHQVDDQGAASLDGLQREALTPTEGEPDGAEAGLGLRIQELRLVERGTGKPVVGQGIRLMFVRHPTAEERLQDEHPAHFRPRDRVWWTLGKAQGVTDDMGVWKVEIPDQSTFLFLDLGIHNPTHSLEQYGNGSASYPIAGTTPVPIQLAMVRRTGTASGYVLDEEGNPVGDAVVDVFYDAAFRDAGAPTRSVLTTADGRFTIDGFACDQGPVRLRARKPGYVTIGELRMERYAGFGVDYPGISLPLASPGGSVAVLVTDSQGGPLEGVDVLGALASSRTVVGKYAFGSYYEDWSVHGTTDTDGRVEIPDVAQRTLRWRARHPELLDWEQTLESTPPILPIALGRGGSLEVRVTAAGLPLPDAVIGVYGPTTRRVVVTAPSGGVSITGLDPQEELWVTVSHPEAALWVSAPLTAQVSGGFLDVTMEPGLTISGRVTGEGGLSDGSTKVDRAFLEEVYPQTMPEILLLDQSPEASSWLQVVGLDVASVAADGSFTFRGLPEMDAKLWYGMRQRPRGLARTHAGSRDVLLSPGSGMEGLAQVDVRVSERRSGLPVTTYYLHWRREVAGEEQDIPGVTVKDPEGRHRQGGLEPGPWSLVVWAPQGYTTRRLTSLGLTAGPQAVEVTLDFARSLRLRLVDEQGVGVEGVAVTVEDWDGDLLLQTGFDGNGFEDRLITDARGQLTLTSVPAEQAYRVVCRKEGFTHTFDLPGAQVEGEMRTLVMPLPANH